MFNLTKNITLDVIVVLVAIYIFKPFFTAIIERIAEGFMNGSRRENDSKFMEILDNNAKVLEKNTKVIDKLTNFLETQFRVQEERYTIEKELWAKQEHSLEKLHDTVNEINNCTKQTYAYMCREK